MTPPTPAERSSPAPPEPPTLPTPSPTPSATPLAGPKDLPHEVAGTATTSPQRQLRQFTSNDIKPMANLLEKSHIAIDPDGERSWVTRELNSRALTCQDNKNTHYLTYICAVEVLRKRHALPTPAGLPKPHVVLAIKNRLRQGSIEFVGAERCHACQSVKSQYKWLGCWNQPGNTRCSFCLIGGRPSCFPTVGNGEDEPATVEQATADHESGSSDTAVPNRSTVAQSPSSTTKRRRRRACSVPRSAPNTPGASSTSTLTPKRRRITIKMPPKQSTLNDHGGVGSAPARREPKPDDPTPSEQAHGDGLGQEIANLNQLLADINQMVDLGLPVLSPNARFPNVSPPTTAPTPPAPQAIADLSSTVITQLDMGVHAGHGDLGEEQPPPIPVSPTVPSPTYAVALAHQLAFAWRLFQESFNHSLELSMPTASLEIFATTFQSKAVSAARSGLLDQELTSEVCVNWIKVERHLLNIIRVQDSCMIANLCEDVSEIDELVKKISSAHRRPSTGEVAM